MKMEAAGPAPGVVLDPKGVMNHKTGVGFIPGGATAQPALPPGVPHNTDPLHPALPGHPDVGTHAGIEGGQGAHHKLLMAMHSTLKGIDSHLSQPKAKPPALNIHTPDGRKYRVEPEEQQ